MHKKGSEINILICFDTTSFFQCLVHIICWEGVWKSCPEVCGIQKSIMYHSNLLYMFYLFLFKILFIYTQLNSLLFPWFLVILLFMKYSQKEVDWSAGATECSSHMERKKQSTLKYSQSFQMAFLPSDEDQAPCFGHCFRVTTRIFYWLDRRHSMGSPVNNWLVSTAPLCMTPCPEPGHLKWPVVN